MNKCDIGNCTWEGFNRALHKSLKHNIRTAQQRARAKSIRSIGEAIERYGHDLTLSDIYDLMKDMGNLIEEKKRSYSEYKDSQDKEFKKLLERVREIGGKA